MRSLEGANCADLPGFVIDKYFGANVARQPFLARTAKAICSHCVVMEECRSEALTMPYLPKRGVIGGVNVSEIHDARAWQRYESGEIDRPPTRPRPEWLTRSDADEIVEQARLEQDPDEATESL